MTFLKFIAAAFATLGLTACASTPRISGEASADLDTLTAWMSGSFSSAAQSAADPENYRDIRLQMIPIWTDRNDGPWLYVEQAAATTPEKPYRQRIYRLSKASSKDTFESAVFELPGDPLIFAGAWKTPELLEGVSPEDLAPRTGCTISLRFQDAAFRGSTTGQDCLSTLRGAAYATSEVTIEKSRLVSWDRGFDAEGAQKWGAEKGGYVFARE